MLFALYVSEVANSLTLAVEGFRVGAVTVSSLFFAGGIQKYCGRNALLMVKWDPFLWKV